jgi:hypothetical protein
MVADAGVDVKMSLDDFRVLGGSVDGGPGWFGRRQGIPEAKADMVLIIEDCIARDFVWGDFLVMLGMTCFFVCAAYPAGQTDGIAMRSDGVDFEFRRSLKIEP